MKRTMIVISLVLVTAFGAVANAYADPPPPARGVHPEDLPLRPSCGSEQHTEVRGEYEVTTIADVPCPTLDSVRPTTAYRGQWVELRGRSFGDHQDMIGSLPGEKRVVIMAVVPSGDPMPTPWRMEVDDWTSTSLQARIPDHLAPGVYRIGIMYPLLPGSHLAYGLVSNMVTITVRSHGR